MKKRNYRRVWVKGYWRKQYIKKKIGGKKDGKKIKNWLQKIQHRGI
jgi:hypothetical protein